LEQNRASNITVCSEPHKYGFKLVIETPMKGSQMALPLTGIRVLDLTHAMAGPMCTMFLADLGAEVIKIEPPWGEMTRVFPPLINGGSPYFVFLNRNKKALSLNLKSPKAVEIFKALSKISDVVIENFSVGVMDRLGIGYEALREINPKIIFTSITGFGQYGPYSNRLSFDPIAQAASGYMFLNQQMADPQGPPVQAPDAIADSVPALFAVIGVLTSLYHRQLTGVGQRIDVAQVDSMISILPSVSFFQLAGVTFHEAIEKYRVGVSGLYRAKDSYVMITTPPGDIFDRFAKMLGVETVDEKVVESWAKERSTEEIVSKLVETRVPVARVLNIEQMMKDPHVNARHMIVEMDHPQTGATKMPNFPLKMSESPGTVRTRAPLIGEHNAEILGGLLGMPIEEIERLKKEQVL